MAYTTIDDPSAYFQTTLYTGNGGGSGQAITHSGNSDLQADWIWIKNRTDAENHSATDSVRGVGKGVLPNSADAESNNNSNGYLTSFDSDGFTTANAGVYNNANGKNYVSWNWKAGTSFTNDASSTSIGSIDSAGSFNNDAGFSIFTFTGAGSIGTVKHGLNTKPDVIFIKGRNDAKAWTIYHSSLGATKAVFLQATDTAVDHERYWNDVEPTTSVFTAGSSTNLTGDGLTFVGYAFTAKQGYSKFGSYLGNGNANGAFIHTGFKPNWIMIKSSTVARNWGINDIKRSPINQTQDTLYANVNDAETGSGNYIDFLSNGFKLRDTALTMNGAHTYIYLAFAENPFVTSTGIPATAK